MTAEEYKTRKKYKEGALKRKLQVKELGNPGDLIARANAMKVKAKLSKQKLAIMGLI